MTPAIDTRRREEALETACALFMRFGYRKTSMDEIARAVGISRQGLYLWFPNKESLFEEMIAHLVGRMRAGIEAVLADGSRSATDRVVDAFEVYTGSFVSAGMNATAMDELLETASRIVGDRVQQFEVEFRGRIAAALEGLDHDGLTPADLAEVIYAVSAGTKYRVTSREEYVDRMRTAVRAVCRTSPRRGEA